MLEDLKIPVEHPLIRKSSRYKPKTDQKDFRKQAMPENDKTDVEEENFSLHCVQNSQKDRREKSETFQETPVECSNGWEASEGEHPFV